MITSLIYMKKVQISGIGFLLQVVFTEKVHYVITNHSTGR